MMFEFMSKSHLAGKGVSSFGPEVSSSARAESLSDLSIHPESQSEGELMTGLMMMTTLVQSDHPRSAVGQTLQTLWETPCHP